MFGRKFKLVTDHKPLIFIKDSSKNSKIIRWRLALENYDYDVEYKTRKTNLVADALSRKLETNNNEIDSSTEIESTTPNPSDTDTVHSAKSSQDFFIHFTERPINYFRNQIIFKVTQPEGIIQDVPFPNQKRITISKSSYSPSDIESFIRKFHDGKKSAIHVPEKLFNTIQNANRKYSVETLSHFVIAQNIVKNVATDEDQYALIKREHDRAHKGAQEIEYQLKRSYSITSQD